MRVSLVFTSAVEVLLRIVGTAQTVCCSLVLPPPNLHTKCWCWLGAFPDVVALLACGREPTVPLLLTVVLITVQQEPSCI